MTLQPNEKLSSPLVLSYPLETQRVTQGFGVRQACISTNPFAPRKVARKILWLVCPRGMVDMYTSQGLKGHNGIDYAAYTGQPCYYAGPDGFVEEVEDEPARGLGLGIITDEAWAFAGGIYHAKTRYWHLKGFNVAKGDKIKRGDLMGWCDSTGASSDPHLHFELKAVAQSADGWYNIFQNNGYYGAICPCPYLNVKE